MVRRFTKFSAVGIAGTGVQLLALALYLKLHANYLWATAAAVETAILHNFLWHSLWTWRECTCSQHRAGAAQKGDWPPRRDRRARLRCAGQSLGHFWRFQASNGVVSIASNVALMRLLTGSSGIPPVPANLIAVAATSLVNFWLGDRFVFRADLATRNSAGHSQNHAELRLSAQHSLVRVIDAIERENLVHRPHSGEYAEPQRVLRIDGCARVPPLHR